MDMACARPASSASANGASLLKASTRAVVVGDRRNLEPAHGAALGMQHDEVQAGQDVMLAAPGHMAHFVGDQPADGVEFLIVVRGRQFHPEGFADALDVSVAVDPISPVGQAEDVALVLGDVELVLDLADDLLDRKSTRLNSS